MTCLRNIVVDHIGLRNITYRLQLFPASYEWDIHFPVQYLEGLTSAEEMALGRMEHARSEALSDATRVPLSPRHRPLLGPL